MVNQRKNNYQGIFTLNNEEKLYIYERDENIYQNIVAKMCRKNVEINSELDL